MALRSDLGVVLQHGDLRKLQEGLSIAICTLYEALKFSKEIHVCNQYACRG